MIGVHKLHWQHLCLFRPDRVKALVNLSVPYWPRSPNIKPIKAITEIFGEGVFVCLYCWSQEEKKNHFSKYDSLTILKKFLFINAPDHLLADPPGVEIIDFLETPPSLPQNWELLGPWQGARITKTTKFITGGFHLSGTKDYYVEGEEFRSLVTYLEVVVIDGHHFIQQEKLNKLPLKSYPFSARKSRV
ncbi:Alpha/beta-Hydrolases superfamily protein [Theobroma cacao]|uniref:Alpha/beta-Hydrolases superfamily protein n=1 Tax=Theobroma cacao TaxID=3641 RepID=A0A061DYX5_THECC|nr:Alpha/beta-Hydrolases superfamily protein [Theobroma cacao]